MLAPHNLLSVDWFDSHTYSCRSRIEETIHITKEGGGEGDMGEGRGGRTREGG